MMPSSSHHMTAQPTLLQPPRRRQERGQWPQQPRQLHSSVLSSVLFLLVILATTALGSGESDGLVTPNGCVTTIDDEERLEPAWIDFRKGQFGFVQTPGFPHHFPLPLRCIWVFNRTEEHIFLHIYFTQYYLRKSYLTISTWDEWPYEMTTADDEGGQGRLRIRRYDDRKLSFAQIESWKALNKSDGDDWQSYQTLRNSGEKYTVLALDIKQNSYDGLHDRVLEVSDTYGFNITFEGDSSTRPRSKRCNLKTCNYNGQCQFTANLSDYYCNCTYPRDAPTQTRHFEGDQCQFSAGRKQCEKEINICQNGGQCRYRTSQFVECYCQEGWTGDVCDQRKPPPRIDKICGGQCKRFFAAWKIPSTVVNKTYELMTQGDWLSGEQARFDKLRNINISMKANESALVFSSCLEKDDLDELQQFSDLDLRPNLACKDGTVRSTQLQLDVLQSEKLSLEFQRLNQGLSMLIRQLGALNKLNGLQIFRRDFVNPVVDGWSSIIVEGKSVIKKGEEESVCLEEADLQLASARIDKLLRRNGGLLEKTTTLTMQPPMDYPQKTTTTSLVQPMNYPLCIKVNNEQFDGQRSRIAEQVALEGQEFHVSCTAMTSSSGAGDVTRTVFRLTKDGYEVNTSIANRYMNLIEHADGNNVNAILLINRASIHDDGIFICTAYDLGNDPRPKNDADLALYPHVSAQVKVSIVTKPKIKVFPLTTTLIMSNTADYKYGIGNNELSCFAREIRGAGDHYVFEWLKNGQPITNNAQISSSKIEYVEPMKKPRGLMLKLGKITSGAKYTCRVYDRREKWLREKSGGGSGGGGGSRNLRPKFVSELSVPVHVAKSDSETCGRSNGIERDGRVWPMTLKGQTAATTCLNGDGSVLLKCNPTSTVGINQWARHTVEHCVRNTFIQRFQEVQRFFDGYVTPKGPPAAAAAAAEDRFLLPHTLLKRLPDYGASKPPTVQEWDKIIRLTRRILEYFKVKGKATEFDFKALSVDFFTKTLSWLSENGRRPIHESNGGSSYDPDRVFDIFNLVVTSARIFGRRIDELPFVAKPRMEDRTNNFAVNNHNDIVVGGGSDENGGSGGGDQSCNNGLIYVKMDRLDRTSSTTFIKGQPLRESRKECPGLTSVKIEVGPPPPPSSMRSGSTFKRHFRHPLSAVIFFKDLEQVLTRKHNETVSENGDVTISYRRNSTLVTVIKDDEHSAPINISIRFHDFKLARNDTRLEQNSITCGSVMFGKRSDFTAHKHSMWLREDRSCTLEYHPQGLTCHCTKPGTYALLEATKDGTAMASLLRSGDHYVVVVCCAWSFTLCLLACIALWWHLYKLKSHSFVVFLHSIVSAAMAAVMAILIIAVIQFLPQEQMDNVNLTLQLLFTSTLTFHAIIVTSTCLKNYNKLTNFKIKFLSIMMAIMIPTFYGILAYNLFENESASDHHSDGWKRRLDLNANDDAVEIRPVATSAAGASWFVVKDSPQFVAYLVTNATLLAVLITFYVFNVRGSHACTGDVGHNSGGSAGSGMRKEGGGRVSGSVPATAASTTSVQHALYNAACVTLLQVCVFLYVNEVDQGSYLAEFCLALPCGLVGTVLLWCYVVRGSANPLYYEPAPSSVVLTAAVAKKQGDNVHHHHHREVSSDKRTAVIRTSATSVKSVESRAAADLPPFAAKKSGSHGGGTSVFPSEDEGDMAVLSREACHFRPVKATPSSAQMSKNLHQTSSSKSVSSSAKKPHHFGKLQQQQLGDTGLPIKLLPKSESTLINMHPPKTNDSAMSAPFNLIGDGNNALSEVGGSPPFSLPTSVFGGGGVLATPSPSPHGHRRQRSPVPLQRIILEAECHAAVEATAAAAHHHHHHCCNDVIAKKHCMTSFSTAAGEQLMTSFSTTGTAADKQLMEPTIRPNTAIGGGSKASSKRAPRNGSGCTSEYVGPNSKSSEEAKYMLMNSRLQQQQQPPQQQVQQPQPQSSSSSSASTTFDPSSFSGGCSASTAAIACRPLLLSSDSTTCSTSSSGSSGHNQSTGTPALLRGWQVAAAAAESPEEEVEKQDDDESNNNSHAYMPIQSYQQQRQLTAAAATTGRRDRQTSTGVESNGPTSSEGNDFDDERRSFLKQEEEEDNDDDEEEELLLPDEDSPASFNKHQQHLGQRALTPAAAAAAMAASTVGADNDATSTAASTATVAAAAAAAVDSCWKSTSSRNFSDDSIPMTNNNNNNNDEDIYI